jgi:prolyl-tRNA synthetase
MRRWSQCFIPTLREAPPDAQTASHKLLLRAGYIRQFGAGLYSYLFLGRRSMLKIAAIIREEMDGIGQEFCLPSLHPHDFVDARARWQTAGEEMFRLKDRAERGLSLDWTDEEVVSDIA